MLCLETPKYEGFVLLIVLSSMVYTTKYVYSVVLITREAN